MRDTIQQGIYPAEEFVWLKIPLWEHIRQTLENFRISAGAAALEIEISISEQWRERGKENKRKFELEKFFHRSLDIGPFLPPRKTKRRAETCTPLETILKRTSSQHLKKFLIPPHTSDSASHLNDNFWHYVNRREWIHLKDCVFSRPAPARGREARKCNPSIASLPTALIV